MKLYLLFCATFNFFTLCLPKPTSQQFTPFYDECSEQVKNFDSDNLKKRFSEKKFQETDDLNTKCFLRCIFTETHLMKEDGSWNYELIYSPFNSPDVVPIALKECLKENIKDPCEKAYLFDKCTSAYEIPEEAQ